jgi:hypothetical protein
MLISAIAVTAFALSPTGRVPPLNTMTGTNITYSVAVRLHAIVCRLLDLNNWFASHQGEIAIEVESSEIRNQKALLRAAERPGSGDTDRSPAQHRKAG